MPNQLPHNTISVLTNVILNCKGNIADTPPCDGLPDTHIQRLQRYAEQTVYFGIHFTNSKGICGITDIAVQVNTSIYRYDVTIAKFIIPGNTMHDLVVYRYTK